MFGGETNVSLVQVNQSSIEILFTVCPRPSQLALSRSKPSAKTVSHCSICRSTALIQRAAPIFINQDFSRVRNYPAEQRLIFLKDLSETGAAPAPEFQPTALFTPTPKAAKRVLEFFTAQINNDHTRRAYMNATRRFTGSLWSPVFRPHL
jgi:hypothetical protein